MVSATVKGILLDVDYSIDPKKDIAQLNLGLFYYNRGDKEKALRCFNESVRFNGNNMKALYNIGLYYRDSRDPAGAEKY